MPAAHVVTRIVRLCCASLCAAFGATVLDAQPSIPATDLARCAEIETNAVRLACFDVLARELGSDGNAERAAPEPAVSESANTMPATGNEDAFGAEFIRDAEAQGPSQIDSRLVGEFSGWRGNTTFTLENGQVWRQSEEGSLFFRSDSPLVTIRRGAFSSYRLSVEGINRAVRVRRIE